MGEKDNSEGDDIVDEMKSNSTTHRIGVQDGSFVLDRQVFQDDPDTFPSEEVFQIVRGQVERLGIPYSGRFEPSRKVDVVGVSGMSAARQFASADHETLLRNASTTG